VTTSGSNRILVVVVTHDDDLTADTVTYAGAPLTKVRSDKNLDKAETSIWYKTNPATGSNTVSVDASGEVPLFDAISYSLLGVDQTNPVDVDNGATGTSTSATVDLTTTVENTWVIDAVFAEESRAMIAHTGRTQRLNAAKAKGGASSTVADAAIATHTMDWTISKSKEWAISAAAFKPVPGAGTWVSDSESYNSTNHIVTMTGDGFKLNHDYKVAYYDGSGVKVQTEFTNTSSGSALESQYNFRANSGADYGDWHSVVLDGPAPNTYAAAIANDKYVVDDGFYVAESAIPEFPTVIAAIAVCLLSAVSYMVMRRKAGKG